MKAADATTGLTPLHAAQKVVLDATPTLGLEKISILDSLGRVLGEDIVAERDNPLWDNSLTPHPVIDLLPEQHGVTAKGGTMRLGAYPCTLVPGSLARAAYGQDEIQERHRHRYEFNSAYRERFLEAGMAQTGIYPGRTLVEIVELPGHPWFLGCQFHPEFKSRPWAAHPLFREFVKAARGPREQASPAAIDAAETQRP